MVHPVTGHFHSACADAASEAAGAAWPDPSRRTARAVPAGSRPFGPVICLPGRRRLLGQRQLIASTSSYCLRRRDQ